MKRLRGLSAILLLLLLITLSFGQASLPTDDGLTTTLNQFLDLYVHKDVAGVMAMVANNDVLVMGSDLSEVCTTREQVKDLLQNDFKLWDSASFGKPDQVFTQRSAYGDMVTAFFDVPFTMHRAGDEQTVVVRFAIVWKRTPQGLKLVQEMNTVPTVGQSAKELLTPKK